MNENKIKTMLDVEILNRMNDQSAAGVLRKILFSEETKINWNETYNLIMVIMVFMPELKYVDDYKAKNME